MTTCSSRASRVVATLAIAVLASGCGTTHYTMVYPSPGLGAAALPSAGPMDADRGHRHRRHGRRHHATGAAIAGGAALAAAARPTATGNGTYPCDNAQFLRDQSRFANGSLQGDQEVDVCGTVTSVLAERDTRSGLHGYYDLQIAPGSVIEIVSDLGEMDAPAWPWVKVGDYSYVQGRYYYDSASSQGIDWTHHGTSNSWPTAGYVVVAGTQYQ